MHAMIFNRKPRLRNSSARFFKRRALSSWVPLALLGGVSVAALAAALEALADITRKRLGCVVVRQQGPEAKSSSNEAGG